jgi:hypothetical protein
VGRRLGQIAAPIVVLGIVAAVCVRHAEDVRAAIDAVPSWAFATAITLHVASLVLRSEAWGLSLAAVEGRPLPRGVIHRANAAAFLAGALQSQAALPARVAMLRRMAGDRAPRPGQICVADVPIIAIELLLTAALLVAGVLAGLGPLWTAPAALALAVGVLASLNWLRRRFEHRPLVRGLAVLADCRRRGRLVALAAGICAATVARVWLLLAVCGLPHGLGEVGWLFAALGAFGLLPAGPGTPAGATLATLGPSGVGGAVALGLVLSATSIAAVVVYGCWVSIVVKGRSARAGARSRRARRRESARSSDGRGRGSRSNPWSAGRARRRARTAAASARGRA